MTPFWSPRHDADCCCFSEREEKVGKLFSHKLKRAKARGDLRSGVSARSETCAEHGLRRTTLAPACPQRPHGGIFRWLGGGRECLSPVTHCRRRMRPAGGVAADQASRPCKMDAVERYFMHGSAQDACSRRLLGCTRRHFLRFSAASARVPPGVSGGYRP